MIELAADEEALVQIEGIEIMVEYMKVIKKSALEKDFCPQLEKMLKLGQDTVTGDEIRIRMAKVCG